MKSFPFVLRRLLPCLFVMVLSSCELLDYLLQEEFPQDEKAEIVIGSDKEIKVNPEGESVLIGFTSSHSWDLELKFASDDEWITADKTSGQPGTVSLRLTVLANDTEQMRKAEMTISSGDTTATVILAQEPKGSEDTPSFKILSEDAFVGPEGGIVEVTLISNIEYSMKVVDEWVHEMDIRTADQITHVFEVDENPTTEQRVAYIAFCTDELCIPYIITQEGKENTEIPDDPKDPEWNGIVDEGWESMEFVHRPIAMRFTADWCGYCPMMAEAFEILSGNLNGNIEVMSLHCSGGLAYDSCNILANQYQVSGYPSGIIDGMTEVVNYSSTSYTASLALDAVRFTESNFATLTSAGWVSSVSGRQVSISLSAYLREAGTYRITVLAVEDDIHGYQNGEGYDYVHNGVVRHAFSKIEGDEYVATVSNDVAKLSYLGEISDSCNMDNMRIVVYIQRSMGSKTGLATGNYGGYFIDNSATSKIGQTHYIDVEKISGTEDINKGDDINLQ